MPNWCYNEFAVMGDHKELQRFKKFAKTGKNVLDAEKFIPYPEEFKKQDEIMRKIEKMPEKQRKEYKDDPAFQKDGFNSGGYEWCSTYWGTKWGICNPALNSEEKNELIYIFNTAWSPPLPVIEKMGKMFPKLEFNLEYFEGGAGFKGKLIIKKGKVIENSSSGYNGDLGG